MAAKSKKQVLDAKFFLVLVDETEELHQALYYACIRAKLSLNKQVFLEKRSLNLFKFDGCDKFYFLRARSRFTRFSYC